MALVLNDRVRESSTTTGTGAMALGGAVVGFQTFAAGIGNSNTCYYAISLRGGAEFETGLGTLDGSSANLTRTTVFQSSNSDNAVSFSAGTKDVFVTLPASKAVFEDGSGDVTVPNDLILGSDSAILKFGADSDITITHAADTGLTTNGTFQATTITATTAFVPDASDGATLGTTSLEFSDLFLADGGTIKFGADQDINITHVADTGLTTNGDFTVGDDLFVSGGVIDLKNTGTASQMLFYCESSNAHAQTLQAAPHSQSATNTLLLPAGGNSTLVSESHTQTLTNKTLTTPILTTPIANAGVQLKNGATSAGFLEFFEDSDNGTNKVTLIGPASTADVTIVLPAAADTLIGKATTDTLTNKSIDSDNNTITNLVNADIKASAAIAFSKMADLTASRALVSDGNGDVSVSAVTSTEVGYLDGVTSAIQTQINTKTTAGFAVAMAIAL